MANYVAWTGLLVAGMSVETIDSHPVAWLILVAAFLALWAVVYLVTRPWRANRKLAARRRLAIQRRDYRERHGKHLPDYQRQLGEYRIIEAKKEQA